MSQKDEFPRLREQAIALRRAGKSRLEIKQILGIRSNQTLNDALRGEPPQPWTWRPNAKDDLHARARKLREQGLAYHQIAAELGVSKSTISLWVRDLPRPPGLSYEECRRRAAEGVRRYWAAEHPRREARRQAVADAAAASRVWRPHSSVPRASSVTTRKQSGRTRVTITTAACASKSGEAVTCTGRSKAGLPR